jgi:hypothetical protein
VSSTNDLDREVRDLLDERAASAGAPPPFGRSVRRRVRGRQSLTAAGAAVVVAVVALPFVIVPSLLDSDDRKGDTALPVESVTSTVYGVSITYPTDWTLLQLNDRLKMNGTETSSLFQLSNFDPLDENHLTCPLPSGEIPLGGAMLFVQEILTPSEAPPWPVELDEGTPTFDTCGQRVARWQVGGRTFEAGVWGDLEGEAFGDLEDAFRSMTFEPPDDDPPLGVQNTTVGDAYVLASGRENGEPWNLLAFRYRDMSDNVLCLLLDPIGRREGSCVPNPIQNALFYEFALSVEQASDRLYAFGTAPADAEVIETLAGRRLPVAPLPAGLGVPFQSFAGPADEVTADGASLVEVRLVGGGDEDRRQWIEPSSVEAGAPGVKAFGHAFGELWWLYDDGERVYLKTRGGWLRRTPTRLLPAGEHLQALSHTFQEETESGVAYDTVVFGVSSGEADQVTAVFATGEAIHASIRTLEFEIHGPDAIDLGHVFWLSIPGRVRGEIVAMDTGCRVLVRETIDSETPSPQSVSPGPKPELPCIGP